MPRLGSSHLVEHLALWPSRRLEHPFNGWVEDAVTGFHCSGTPEEVVAFLAATTAALRALPLDRLDVERRVLVAEASARRPSVFAHHRSARFGPQGYGLCDQYEFAIDWLPASDIEAWSASHFTRENAVLWLSGPPPADLRLDLPSGSASAPPAPGDGIPQLVLPAHQDLDQGGVSLSLVGDRTAAMHLALGVLVDRAVDELRQTTGASYAPDGAYDVLDGRHVQLLVQADCRRPDAPEVLDALLRSLDGLAEHGPTDDEMARDRRRLTEWLTEPEATMTRLDWHARNELLGLPAETAGALLSEREALTPDAVATEVRASLPSLLTVAAVPVGRVGRDGMSAYERPAPAERSGRIYVTTKQWRGFNIDMTIALDEEGLTYRQRYTEKARRRTRRCRSGSTTSWPRRGSPAVGWPSSTGRASTSPCTPSGSSTGPSCCSSCSTPSAPTG
jgi:zinc protease